MGVLSNSKYRKDVEAFMYTEYLVGLCMAGLLTAEKCGKYESKIEAEITDALKVLHTSQSGIGSKIWISELLLAMIFEKLGSSTKAVEDRVQFAVQLNEKTAITREEVASGYEYFQGAIFWGLGQSPTTDYAPLQRFLKNGMDHWSEETTALIAKKAYEFVQTFYGKTPLLCCATHALAFYSVLEKALEKTHLDKFTPAAVLTHS